MTERDNVRAAVEWAIRQDRNRDSVAIVANLAYGWYMSGSTNERRALLNLDRVESGQVIADGSPDEVSADPAVVTAYFGGVL